MRLRALLPASVTILAFLSLATLGTAQEAVRGTLLDRESHAVVTGATVTVLLGERRLASTITGDDGTFLLALPTQGSYRLEATRIGYGVTLSQPILVEEQDTVTVEFRIHPDAVPVEPITVTAHSSRGRSRFLGRMEGWGEGLYITPAMVDSIGPRHPADVLEDQESVWLHWEHYAPRRPSLTESTVPRLIPRVRMLKGEGCLVYMINNVPVRPPTWDRTTPIWLVHPLVGLRPEDVVAVEVYRGIGEVPPELRRWADDADPLGDESRLCGLVNFWTREGW